MSKKAALDKELDWLRTIITLVAAAIFGISAWISHNYKKAELFEMIAASLMLLVVVIAAILVSNKNKEKLEEMKELEE